MKRTALRLEFTSFRHNFFALPSSIVVKFEILLHYQLFPVILSLLIENISHEFVQRSRNAHWNSNWFLSWRVRLTLEWCCDLNRLLFYFLQILQHFRSWWIEMLKDLCYYDLFTFKCKLQGLCVSVWVAFSLLSFKCLTKCVIGC